MSDTIENGFDQNEGFVINFNQDFTYVYNITITKTKYKFFIIIYFTILPTSTIIINKFRI